MSLYYEAAALLANADAKGGSLKSRIFGKKDLKSSPGAVFALITEATKWSAPLKDIIERSEILKLEKRLTPTLALLLAHDLLLSKKGIAAPKQHVLSLTITRHKARLTAEFTKCRLRNGFAAIEAWRAQINDASKGTAEGDHASGFSFSHPRWIRINLLKTTKEQCLTTSFGDFTRVKSLQDIRGTEKRLYIDDHIPDLIAISSKTDLSKHAAYLAGEIILQDKASCFPAYLLNPQPEDKHVIDATAAPGNKTTHLAAILTSHNKQSSSIEPHKVTACERDKLRAQTLKKMVKLAGGDTIVSVKAGQDFTRLDPNSAEYADVGALLLDPSCSGSGIVGRDDMPVLHLPSLQASQQPKTTSKKRKRKGTDDEQVDKGTADSLEEEAPQSAELEADKAKLQTRLANLAAFQLKIILHAFRFPTARRITYSTCSVHAEENEQVVIKALLSDLAKELGWRILQREDQVEGLRKWERRGSVKACEDMLARSGVESLHAETIADACIRCEKGTEERTMGFFVAGFVRDEAALDQSTHHDAGAMQDANEDEEWEGFSDAS